MSTTALGADCRSEPVVDRVAELEAELAERDARIAQLEKERDILRGSHEELRLELELLKRRIFLAKAERVDSSQLELEFAAKPRTLEELAGTLDLPAKQESSGASGAPRSKPTGRRNLRDMQIEERRVELKDPVFEELVAAGVAERIAFEESYKLAWQRGGVRKLVVARAKYRLRDSTGEPTQAITPMPRECFVRSIGAPSLIAHVVMQKHGYGLPSSGSRNSFRAMMSRSIAARCRVWMEDAGATVGATIVEAMRKDALANAFCIATDATGIAVQPVRSPDKHQRRACDRGHYFTMIADRDYVFFEYTRHETSAAVASMFRGFKGYVQADAKSVFNMLFSGDKSSSDDEAADCAEVGCWAHCRRKFWEAACAEFEIGREGLRRIARIYELEATWRTKPPAEIKRLRDRHLRPHMDAFFAWTTETFAQVSDQRGMVRSALGYAVRQQEALRRVLEDGRLVLDNNRSERALRKIAVGRKAWLFVGSDDHAEAAGNLLTVIATAQLQQLDAETYLKEIFRVLPHWPADRSLELSPKHWAATRARLQEHELSEEIGELAVPEPVTSSD